MGTSKTHGNCKTVVMGMLFLLPPTPTASLSAIIMPTVLTLSGNWFCHPILSLKNQSCYIHFQSQGSWFLVFEECCYFIQEKQPPTRWKEVATNSPFPPTSMVKTQDQRISPMLPVKTFLHCLKTGPSDPGLLCGHEPLSEGEAALCSQQAWYREGDLRERVGSWLGPVSWRKIPQMGKADFNCGRVRGAS